MHEYYAQENGKIYYAITSRDARENDATQTSEASKYQIISQPKLDKFQLQQASILHGKHLDGVSCKMTSSELHVPIFPAALNAW